jgi:hypothetical protein
MLRKSSRLSNIASLVIEYVIYNIDIKVKYIKYYIRSLESFLLYSSFILTFLILDY